MKITGLIVCVLLLGSFVAKAQQSLKEVRKVNYYGIDFSKVKIYRTQESEAQFQRAFKAINDLTLLEDKKYDFAKFFRKSVEWKSFEVADQRNFSNEAFLLPPKLSRKQLNEIRLSDAELGEVVGNYGNGDDGVGVVIIGVLLNKEVPEGIYEVVFFDVQSKEIVFHKEVRGKARGFGLRNYWAYSVYDALKRWK